MVRYGNNLNVALPPVVIHGVVHGGGPVSNTTIAAIFDAGQSKTFALTVAGFSPGVHELSTFATTNDGGVISWKPKPGAVTEFGVTAEYTDNSGVSWTKWVAIVASSAVGVALIVLGLALLGHRRHQQQLAAERAKVS